MYDLKDLAFEITAAFEGGSYASYNNYDTGIVSYGRFQFTLSSGSLLNVLDLYLKNTAFKNETVVGWLRDHFLPRVEAKDPTLRKDSAFKAVLVYVSDDPAMRRAQNAVATALYWDVVMRDTVEPRGLVLPLSICFAFDTGIHHGVAHNLFRRAEEQMGVAYKSKTEDEQRLLTLAAERRRSILIAQANRMGLDGLKWRARFWANQAARGNWNLEQRPLVLRPGLEIR